ncbi:MAG: hypothetical protein PQ975_06795 [Methanobacterium sp.]|jgi:hypothetical protein
MSRTIDAAQLSEKIDKYKDFIEEIKIYGDSSEIDINLTFDGNKIELEHPSILLNGDQNE